MEYYLVFCSGVNKYTFDADVNTQIEILNKGIGFGGSAMWISWSQSGHL